MRKNKETIILAEIRRLIRRKSRQHDLSDEVGNLHFWDREDYTKAKKARRNKKGLMDGYYYSKSRKAIEDLAKEIYEAIKILQAKK